MSDIYDEYREPPKGCGTAIAGGLAIVAIAIMLLFGCVSCKTTQPLVQTRDSVRVEIRHDSVYVFKHDSIFRDRWREGDTVFVTVEKFKTLYREKLVEVHDTITATQTEQVAVKYVPDYYKHTSTGFWVLLALLIVWLAFKAYKLYIKIQTGGFTWKL